MSLREKMKRGIEKGENARQNRIKGKEGEKVGRKSKNKKKKGK
jgi:hypothetical protein